MSMYFKEKCSNRGEVLKHLSQTKFQTSDDPARFHGRLYKTCPPSPSVTWSSDDRPRHDHQTPDWITASEFQDVNSVLNDKVERLAALLKLSKRTVIYSGAGISTSAGIGQAARSGNDKMSGGVTTDATPTITHLALATLRDKGLVHGWIQQNHDGLPQKAGWPQEDIIEIHGSWYDPSNPVVCYDGNLREDLFSEMKTLEQTADLVIVVGTSLSGLNADKIVTSLAKRSCQGKSLGSVIINLQQTQCDGGATLRIFSECDKLFDKLLSHLNLALDTRGLNPGIPDNKVLVPYDKHGQKTDVQLMWLDLSKGQKIRLHPNHNCQDSGQPLYSHIGASQPQLYRGQVRQPGPGQGTVVRYSPKNGGWELKIEGVSMLLGGWWLEAAQKGRLPSIPVINIDPVFVNRDLDYCSVTQDNYLRPERPRQRKVSDSSDSVFSVKSSSSRASSISRRSKRSHCKSSSREST